MADLKITRGTSLLLMASGACVLAAVGTRALRPIELNVNDPTLNTLSAEVTQLSKYDDAYVTQANDEMTAAKARLWSAQQIVEWRKSLPKEWQVQEIAALPATYSTTRRFVLSWQNAPFKDWPDLVTFITALCEHPGVRITSMALTAPAGSRTNFSQLQLLLTISTPPAEKAPMP